MMRSAMLAIQKHGRSIHPRKGAAKELIGTLIQISNPRARLSRTETRGKLFSGLGELCWYLAGNQDLEFIRHYIKDYENFAENGKLFGGYGPRLFDWAGLNQFRNVAKALQSKDTRQAVIQLFDRNDIVEEHEDVPCTCTLQFMLREGRLNLLTCMRSNDAYLGFPHDVFCFTMLQEIMASALSVDMGIYKHFVGSFHLYEKDFDDSEQFLGEGLQSTVGSEMPPMPAGDPFPAINTLLRAERSLRESGIVDESWIESIDPYWADLIRLLKVYWAKKRKDWGDVRVLKDQFASDSYKIFVDRMLANNPETIAASESNIDQG